MAARPLLSYDKVGDVLTSQGNTQDAIKAYRDSLAIAERLSTADPGNAGWQRDLVINNERIGDIALRQGDMATARAAFERALGNYSNLPTRNDAAPSFYPALSRA